MRREGRFEEMGVFSQDTCLDSVRAASRETVWNGIFMPASMLSYETNSSFRRNLSPMYLDADRPVRMNDPLDESLVAD